MKIEKKSHVENRKLPVHWKSINHGYVSLKAEGKLIRRNRPDSCRRIVYAKPHKGRECSKNFMFASFVS
jgi:hypothetical protein